MSVQLRDVMAGCSGQIQAYLLERGTGRIELIQRRKNVVAYTAADLMARVMAGDSTYLPRHVGFIYGTTPSPLLDDPDAMPAETRRIHDWSKIASDVAAINGNMLVVPLAMAPTVARDGSSALYTANAVTFAAHTGLGLEYAFETTGGTYAQTLESLEDDYGQSIYFYHAVLMTRWESGGRVTYTPFSRAALEPAPFTARPAGHELGVFWTLTYR